MTRAVTLKTNDRPPSKPIFDEAEIRKGIASRLKPFDDPFTLHIWGEAEGPPRKRADAVLRTFKAVTHGPIGLQLATKNKAEKGILSHVVDIMTPASVTNGNEKVDEWFFALMHEFGGLINLGVTVNKNIGSTGTISQHHDWTEESIASAKADNFSSAAVSDGGNAADIGHATRQTMSSMFYWTLDRVAQFEIQNLIHWPIGKPYPLIWNPENGLHRYDVPSGGDNHAYHLHGDFRHSRPWGGSVARY